MNNTGYIAQPAELFRIHAKRIQRQKKDDALMELYQLLSKNYDQVFPVSNQEITFLDSHLTGKKRLLDIGCGTGGKTVRLTSSRSIVGIDGSSDMIAIANSTHPAPDLVYRVMDMLSLTDNFAPGSFDAVLCLGNTLPHLAQPGQVEEFFRQTGRLLSSDGMFIGQTINFDRVIAEKIDRLPVIETDAVIFRRHYIWHGTEMSFRIELEDRATGRIEQRATPMRPILKDDLDTALRAAGFVNPEYFGSFSGDPYTPGCYHLIFKIFHVN